MARITVNVFPADLATELTQSLDTKSLQYLIHDLTAGLSTENVGELARYLEVVYRERKEMDGE